MFTLPRWVLLLSVLLVRGCAVETTQPLSDPLTAEPDESLYGHWVAIDKVDGKTRELHAFVGKHTTTENPDSITEVGMVGWSPAGKKVESSPLTYLTVSRIGKTSYMNLIGVDGSPDFSLSENGSYATWTKNAKKNCTIVRYSCDGKKLQVWTAKDVDEKIMKLSAAGELKLTDGKVTPDSLVRYLRQKGGEDLFNDPVATFSKVP